RRWRSDAAARRSRRSAMSDDRAVGAGQGDRPTMMEVARAAGVSQATVSLILNGSPGARFSADTRHRVRRVAGGLGDTLTPRARRRAAGQTVIGFLADEVTTDPWMALAYEGARDQALESGHTVFLVAARGDPEAEAQALDLMSGGRLLGLIYGTVLTRR